MLITSWVFWAFLAGSVCLYWLLPRNRLWFLFAASAAYLATIDARSVVALLVFSVVFYAAAKRFEDRSRAVTLALIFGVLTYLAYFKYVPVLSQSILGKLWTGPGHVVKPPDTPDGIAKVIIPLGASYFTFKLIHYIIESSRKKFAAHGPDSFLAYMFFFPMFSAGPIERFDAFLKNRADKLTRDHVIEGLTRILYGVVKKVVLVDIVLSAKTKNVPEHLYEAIPVFLPSIRVEKLVLHLDTVNPLFVWQYCINSFAYVYLDFSAYSDIAVGAALLFGIKICENFNWPFLASNIGEFWKRWHMSLSAWCQAYVYLPMIGRTRNPYVATYATMIVMGIWHEGNLNYVGWGIWHATCLSVGLTWARIRRKNKWKALPPALVPLAGAVTFAFVSVSQAFASTGALGIRPALRIFAALFGIRVG